MRYGPNFPFWAVIGFSVSGSIPIVLGSDKSETASSKEKVSGDMDLNKDAVFGFSAFGSSSNTYGPYLPSLNKMS